MHGRRRIINALKAITIAANIPTVTANVFTNRFTPLWKPELPAICFYALKEDVETKTQPKFYERNARIMVEILVEATENSDELVDEIAEALEAILLHQRFLRDPTGPAFEGIPEQDPSNTSDDLVMEGSAITIITEKVDIPLVSCQIALNIPYSYTPNYEGATDKFDTLGVVYALGGSDTAPVSDVITGINQEEGSDGD
jgi:hypothetical protein